jgi:(E)-4-hydroxy-3-methylbut-2-enyl-diphosphate synthase
MVGDVAVGGDAPITVQSMTNTITADAKSTINQIKEQESVGCDITRCSCPDEDSARALKDIVKAVKIPVIADIHFDYKLALIAADNGAACLRINPGNIGGIDRVKEVIKAAQANNCPIRIGVNGGSLEKKLLDKYGEPCADALVESAVEQAKMLEDNGFREYKISVKSSNTMMTIEAYQKLAQLLDCPLHLGVTEAGGLRAGTIKSAIGLGSLLMHGIGDTLRVSLTADVKEEILAGYEILKALDLRHRGIRVISCPTCARRGYDVQKTVETLEQKLSHINAPISIAVMGCVVNGPGEASHADFGVCGGKNGENMLYIYGKSYSKVKSEDIISTLVDLVEAKALNLDKIA